MQKANRTTLIASCVVQAIMLAMFIEPYSYALNASGQLERAREPTAGVLASRIGAALDSDLVNGGGVDDTLPIQAVLDRARDGTSVHLVIDGPALVHGLNVYGNTIIECINGGGLYLRDESNRSIIRNAHRSRTEIRDERIAIRGCFLNGNRWNQSSSLVPGTNAPTNQESDGSFMTGLQFLGVNDLTIENVTLWSIRAYGAWIANANRVGIRGVTIDYGATSNDTRNYGNTDGLHFNGPIHYMTIDDVKVRTADDALALNANDFDTDDVTVRNDMGPYVTQGPIADVSVNNIQLMGTIWGIRLLSGKERIDRVSISNITGTIKGAYVVNISHFIIPQSFGNVGSVSINNADVDRLAPTTWLADQLKDWIKLPALDHELNGGELPFVSINSRVENLSLQNIRTTVADARPILRLGPDAHVEMLAAELRIFDPQLQGNPIELDAGARIETMNLSILWKGSSLDQGKQPIKSLGGTIGRLNWINTPPMYVHAQIHAENFLEVSFSEDVKAIDFVDGVAIRINGKLAHISSATLQDSLNIVSYKLKDKVQPSDTVTWAYNAHNGTIQNLSGNQLLAVSEKAVSLTSQFRNSSGPHTVQLRDSTSLSPCSRKTKIR